MIATLASLAATLMSGFSVRLTDESPPTAERWTGDVVGYRIEHAGSDDLAPDDALAAVRAGFASWTALDCATVSFEEQGDAPDPHVTMATTSAPDGHNDIVWVEDAEWPFGAYVLGVTAPVVKNRVIVEADIAFNGLQVQWTTRGNGGMDLESVAVHEIGHFIGIQHNIGPFEHAAQPTMAPVVAPGIQNRSLEPDDQAAACFLYPAVPYRCASDDDCPLLLSQTFEQNDFYSGRFRCDRAAGGGSGDADAGSSGLGTCSILERFLPEQVGLGEVCHRPEECRDGLECHAFGDAGVCTSGCDPFAPGGDPCPAAMHCQGFPLPLETAGVCVPDDGRVLPPGEGPDGCLSSAICAPGKACLPPPTGSVRRCVMLCRVADGDAGCPLGDGCWSYGQENGGCFEHALWPVEPGPETVEVEPEPEPGPEFESAVEVPDEAADDAAEGAETRSGGRDDGCGAGAGGGGWFGLAMAARAWVERRRRQRRHPD